VVLHAQDETAATLFSLLTALSMVARNILGTPSGWLVESWRFSGYFGFTFSLAVPAFALMSSERGFAL
jgi:hypothetical protein